MSCYFCCTCYSLLWNIIVFRALFFSSQGKLARYFFYLRTNSDLNVRLMSLKLQSDQVGFKLKLTKQVAV